MPDAFLADLDSVEGCETIADLLFARAEYQPDRVIFTHLAGGETPADPLTHAGLVRRAQGIAAFLQSRVKPRQPVLLCYPNEPDFLAAFFGCVLAGAIATPVAPPRNARGMARLATLARSAEAPVALASTALRAGLEKLRTEDGPAWIYPDQIPAGQGHLWQDPGSVPEDIAVLQFTSGSTGNPKGVMVRHRNALHNARCLASQCGTGDAMRMVSWLPYFHDWGLFGCVVFPLYAGGISYYLDPSDFLRRPMRWIEAISTHRATVGCAPNFAYALCADTFGPGGPALDLSSWRLAMLGAEPVRAETLTHFAKTFGPMGFDARALYPSYGLAEATLIVTGKDPGAAPRTRGFDRAALEDGRAAPGEGDTKAIVSCGKPVLDQRLAIVDPDTGEPLADGEVGELCVHGPSVAAGYWRRPVETAETFQTKIDGIGPWLRTGDLAFLQDGELYVCGRLKDMIIKAGHNYFAEDLEQSAERAHPGLRPGCIAAFAIEAMGAERLIIAAEVTYGKKPDLAPIPGAIQKALSQDHAVMADAVAILKPGTLEKTSSGKIRRQYTKTLFETGRLAPLHLWQSWG